MEIREGTIFMEKKKMRKRDVDPTGQIMPSLVGVFFTLGVYGILLTRHANGRIYLHREGRETTKCKRGNFHNGDGGERRGYQCERGCIMMYWNGGTVRRKTRVLLVMSMHVRTGV